ncbi:TonB-dependent receptor [Bradyrhizobium sp. IC3069]|uniref:TonB-dependent receptor n=1 Tax=Bradyrhizobium yuanmingense TaxID=108015 RepID=UPI00201C11BE|nr:MULTISPECIES: TonB-dependent receptor [unclassified Bradyrhizobium]MCA1363513.1 TonB-dependent receptor [Bradyrhizobium sp. IC4059]MCA1521052.1 TonB-dependent receptor [Bradyrhizobium sp. IC3069]
MRLYRWAVGVSALALSTGAHAQTVQLEEIVVTSPSPIAQSGQTTGENVPWWATSQSIPVAPSFSSVSVVTPQQALSRGAASLGDTLSTTPGVSSTSFSPVASRPVIRGLGGFRVRTQEDGIGSGDMANLGEDHAVTIDPLMSGQVEVIRGPGTLRYGSQAIGGVVSANNGRIPTFVPANGIAFQARGGLNSVSNGKDGAVLLDAGGGNFALHLDAFKRSAGDYRIPGGVQENSSYSSQGQSLGGSYIFNDGFVGLSYQSMAMTYFIPGIESARVKNHIDLRQSKWSSRGEWRLREGGIDTIKYWLGYTAYKHLEIDGVGAAAEVGSTFRNREFESRAEISHLPVNTALGELRGAVGLQWGRRDLSVGGADEQLLAPARAQNVAAFVFEELQVTSALRAQGAVRAERTDINGTGARFPASFLPPPNDPTTFPVSRDFVPVSASAGLLYDLPYEMVARVTAQHVERAPDPIELFYKGPHDTPRTFEIGDPTMTLEKANSLELGLKRGRGDTRFDASIFYTKFDNFIFKNFTGVRCGDDFASCGTPGATFDQIIYSQRDAKFVGGELQVEHDVAKVWNGVWGVEAQYDFVRATFTDGSFVPKIPPHRLGGGIFYRDPNWIARVNLLHAFAQHNLGAFETPTAGYNLLNAELSYTTTVPTGSLPMEVSLGLKGENLLNDDIRFHQSYKKDEVLQPGRNIRVFSSVKF